MLDLIQADAVLLTERLRLEPLVPPHAPLLFPVLSDRRIYTYIPDDPPDNPQALRLRYERLASRRSPDRQALWLNWALHRSAERDYIGLAQATLAAGEPAYLAYLLGSAFWGAGYAQEACGRVLQLLFDTYRVASVHAEVDRRNRASWQLLERLGFVRIGLRLSADCFKGSPSDEYTYELTDALWRQQTSGAAAT